MVPRFARAAQPGAARLVAVTPAVRPVRVLHFVTGGFSGGATQVAIQLVNAARESAAIEPLLVLRRKRRTPSEQPTMRSVRFASQRVCASRQRV